MHTDDVVPAWRKPLHQVDVPDLMKSKEGLWKAS
jgi:hypothetical protein